MAHQFSKKKKPTVAAEASDKGRRTGELFDYKPKCDMQMRPKCFTGLMDCRERGTHIEAIVHSSLLVPVSKRSCVDCLDLLSVCRVEAETDAGHVQNPLVLRV